MDGLLVMFAARFMIFIPKDNVLDFVVDPYSTSVDT